jgi:hypothetical protein
MRYFIPLLFLASVLMTIGCGSSSTGPTPPGDYVPLTLGNTWNYSVEGYAYSPSQDTITITGTSTQTITAIVMHQQGFELYEFLNVGVITITTPDTTITSTDTTSMFIYETDTELRVYDDTISTYYELAFPLPVVLGDTWLPDSEDPTVTREVMSVTETVSVPAGNYTNCALMSDTDSEDPGAVFDMYFCPGLGNIKQVVADADSASTSYMEVVLTSSIIE